jgi:hypothetical protein
MDIGKVAHDLEFVIPPMTERFRGRLAYGLRRRNARSSLTGKALFDNPP